MRKPLGITATLIAAIGVFVLLVGMIFGPWLDWAKNLEALDRAERSATQKPVTAMVLDTGPVPADQAQYFEPKSVLALISYPDFEGITRRTTIILVGVGDQRPGTVDMIVSKSGSAEQAAYVAPLDWQSLPRTVGFITAILGGAALIGLGLYVALAWRRYYTNTA